MCDLEKGNPLQYSCLKNPMARRAWRATGYGGHKESDMTEVTQQQQQTEAQRVTHWNTTDDRARWDCGIHETGGGLSVQSRLQRLEGLEVPESGTPVSQAALPW